MLKKALILASVFVVILVVFVNTGNDYKSLAKQLKASHVIYNPDKELPAFSLVDHNNNKFDNQRLKGEWTLLLFIYTHCPDVCPTELANISMLKANLVNSKAKVVPNVVAITFDPLRDSLELLKDYVAYFDKDFLGVSGDKAQIDKLVDVFGAYYEVVIEKDGKIVVQKSSVELPETAVEDGYFINHTAWIYLLSPDGQIFAGFPAPHNVFDMSSDINLIVENY